jgi:hypothetical protein
VPLLHPRHFGWRTIADFTRSTPTASARFRQFECRLISHSNWNADKRALTGDIGSCLSVRRTVSEYAVIHARPVISQVLMYIDLKSSMRIGLSLFICGGAFP